MSETFTDTTGAAVSNFQALCDLRIEIKNIQKLVTTQAPNFKRDFGIATDIKEASIILHRLLKRY